jgi:nucleoside phosphorylase
VYEQGTFADANGQTWHVGIVEIGAGNSKAAAETERALAHFRPEVALFVGVAGGLRDVQLCDVVAARKIYGYESGKAEDEFLPRPEVGMSSYPLIQRAKAEARKQGWLQRVKSAFPAPPQAFVQPIAAGEAVIASNQSTISKFLRKAYSDAVAVEMEGRGFLEAAHANQSVMSLVIRGISDLIDDKSKTDKAGYQRLAADSASAFAFEVLSNFAGLESSQSSKPHHEASFESSRVSEKFMDREESKRRSELAQEVLALFYEIRDVIRFVRSVHVLGQKSTRPRRELESPEVAQARDKAYVLEERLQEHAESFQKLNAKNINLFRFLDVMPKGPSS